MNVLREEATNYCDITYFEFIFYLVYYYLVKLVETSNLRSLYHLRYIQIKSIKFN